MSRPEVLGIGDQVRAEGLVRTVVGLSGTLVRLADVHGGVTAVPLSLLQAASDFEVLDRRRRRAVPAVASLEGLPESVLVRALWWEPHILEVLHGVRPDGGPGTGPRPQYDPARHSLASREQTKAAELVAEGYAVTVATVKRRRQRYETHGLVGLVDHRADKHTTEFGRVDPRVVEAMRTAIDEATQSSTRTVGFIAWRTVQLLQQTADADPAAVPSRRTLYRLFGKLTQGRHTTGSARTRRSEANRPPPPFGQVTPCAPGELVQIDSTPLDVLVRLDDAVVGPVELTGMIDVATRTVTAAVLRPTTKAVDASVLLARTVTPEPMRPGWVDALRMSHSVLPFARLLSIDERLTHATARPVIVPETIVCDHGKVFISRTFRSSCRFLGINFQPAHKGTPTDKPHIERMLGSVATLFAQFVAGYTGSNVERRSTKVEDGPLWSMLELQELLDEWLVAAWQNRPHDELRDPAAPGRAFTPNEKYAALVEAAGYVPVALSADDYVELLPARWQAINAYGIRLNRRTYDAEGLNPLRRQRSAVKEKKGLWEIHHDPYDVSRVWVRNHRDGGWITAFWKHLHRVPTPFGELAWDHVRHERPDGTEEQLADAVAALLSRAHEGPEPPARRGRRARRVAARTRATSRAAAPPDTNATPSHSPDPADRVPPAPAPDDEEDDTPMATVIPLPLFDPFAEARRR
ncbi:Mu transposase C-terminal domain-containing protein [Dactylosporangium maewongense]|uniref:Mu transposase C-terminal domain-containing protein n=1 Tax=Dactylosporangium maewongense TaxID=634393 RepID=UPI0031D7C5E3